MPICNVPIADPVPTPLSSTTAPTADASAVARSPIHIGDPSCASGWRRDDERDISATTAILARCQPSPRAALRRLSAMRSMSAIACSSLSSALTHSICPRAFLSLSSSGSCDGRQSSALLCLLIFYQRRLRRGGSRGPKNRSAWCCAVSRADSGQFHA
jgi:hypothetical protein